MALFLGAGALGCGIIGGCGAPSVDGGPCATSCATALASGDLLCEGTPSGADTDYMALQTCAEASCPAECGTQFYDGTAIDAACADCYAVPCAAEATTCSNN